MRNFLGYDRWQRFLMPPDLADWVADDDLAHFIVAAVERVDISSFHVSRTGSGKAQYHPRMMLALLIYCYATGIFSSRRIERATHRDVSVRFIAANCHPDHDTIATFRRRNGAAFAAAFEQVLLLASEAGLEALLDRMAASPGLPGTLLADAGYAGEEVVTTIAKRGIEPLIAIARQEAERPYDFRPPGEAGKTPRTITTPWRLEMVEKLKTEPARSEYRKRKHSVEPVFGIIKSAIGFTRFHMRGIEKVKSEWTLMTLAYNCKRLTAMMA